MKSSVERSDRNHALFAVVMSIIKNRMGFAPIQFGDPFERQAPLAFVLGALLRVEYNLHGLL